MRRSLEHEENERERRGYIRTAEWFGGSSYQVNGRVVVSWLSVQSELWTVLIRAVEAATLEELVPGNAGNRHERAVRVDALDEVLVTADVIAADEPSYSCG